MRGQFQQFPRRRDFMETKTATIQRERLRYQAERRQKSAAVPPNKALRVAILCARARQVRNEPKHSAPANFQTNVHFLNTLPHKLSSACGMDAEHVMLSVINEQRIP